MPIKTYPDFYPSDFCKIKIGTYTGDGTEGQVITGIGFKPIYVRIWPRPDTPNAQAFGFERISQSFWGDFAIQCSNSFYQRNNAINTMGEDGFTIDDNGADTHPNKNGVTYDYLVLG